MLTSGIASARAAGLCVEDDEYVRDRVRWVILLDNGVTVYGDDDRPGVQPASAWLRLRDHVLAQGLRPIRLVLQCRSHIVDLSERLERCAGLYMARKVTADMGTGETHESYVVGGWLRGMAILETWQVPELILTVTENREVFSHSPFLWVWEPSAIMADTPFRSLLHEETHSSRECEASAAG